MPVLPALLSVPFRFPDTDDPVKLKEQLYRDFDEIGRYLNQAWTAYVPVSTNITPGNGTTSARFTRLGRMVTAQYQLTWGTTTAFGTNIRVGLPVPAQGSYWVGSVWMADQDVTNYVGVAVVGDVDNTSATIYHAVPGSGIGRVTATAPFVWATSDILAMTLTYEAAS